MWKLFIFGLIKVALSANSSDSCQKAQKDCEISHTCGLHFLSVTLMCGNFVNSIEAAEDETSICSEHCQTALLNLERGTKEGNRFAHCECVSTEPSEAPYCKYHNTIFTCLKTKNTDTETTDVVYGLMSCGNARRYCENDWVCRDALHYYEVVCEQHFKHAPTTGSCPSVRCQETFRILMRQQFAQPLNDCLCDMVETPAKSVYCFSADVILHCADAGLVFSSGNRIIFRGSLKILLLILIVFVMQLERLPFTRM